MNHKSKTESFTRPPLFDVSVSGDEAIIRFAVNVTEKVIEAKEDEEQQTVYEYDSYTMTVRNRADLEKDMEAKGTKVLAGEDAFKLYDTYGFPIDLTREILEEKSLGIDEDGFNAAMKRQKEQARAARKTTNYMGADVTVYQSIDPAITTEFIGYDRLTAESEISVLTTEDEIVEALTDGQTGTIITKETPFYGTMGGQCGDTGVIIGAVKQGKKVIAVPRLASYGEHVDDHQVQLLREFDGMNLICACYDSEKLGDCIRDTGSRDFAGYHSNTRRILKDIENFLIAEEGENHGKHSKIS